MKVFRRNYIITLFSLFLLANCTADVGGHTDDHPDRHPWVKYSDEWAAWPSGDYTVKEYPDDCFTIVQYYVDAGRMSDTYKAEYISLLQSQEYVEITKAEANRISLSNFNGNSKKYLVVRALYTFFPNEPYRSGDGSYNILLSGENNLFIDYTVMGDSNYQVKEDALVIEVDKIPDNFYVGFSVAE
ncbi:hypothetical protein AGMMS50267_11060 [Spirochaetia bacterium]|nr:hypothetical protein AGMMS50267_11060 [Spirochaetia bacterium]